MVGRSVSRFTYGSTEDLPSSRFPPQSRAPIARPDGDDANSSSGSTSAKSTKSRSWGWVAAILAVALGLATISVHSSHKSTPGNSTNLKQVEDDQPLSTVGVHRAPMYPMEQSPNNEDDLPNLSFTALNFYHIRDGKPAQDYPWLKDIKLIEPYRETTLTVTNPRPGYHYKWEIRGGGEEDEVHTAANGAEAIVILTKLEQNLITLIEQDSDKNTTRRLDEPVMVKYVRREIRTLTDDEREELLDSRIMCGWVVTDPVRYLLDMMGKENRRSRPEMQKLWDVRVKDGNGREIFGDGYSDIWAINRLHYKAASPQECDHFHDGLGFLTNHALISNTFEYSLQAVNPKLTLPYWDFTIETSSAGEGASGAEDGPSQTMTPVLQESWFGTVDPVDNMVKDGRWAHTPIPRMVENNPSNIEPDVYSKLRAPWNVNNRAYLTRGMGKMCHANVDEMYPWPTCSMHYELATEYDNFYDWVWGSMYDPHGPIHIWIGGVLDCEGVYQEIAELVGNETAGDLALVSFVHRKNLFRDGYFYCTGNVAMDEPPDEVLESGVCGCQGFDLTQGDDFEEIYATMAFLDDYIGDEDNDTKRRVVELLCSNTVNDGDQLQASSSLDPSFWATHPTMERLWMYAILTGRVTNFNWPDKSSEYTGSDGETYTESISLYSDSCEGHRGSDIFPYQLLSMDANDFTVRTGIKGNPDDGGNIFTNREALSAFDPRINSLPYVYDTFKWLHCEKDGYNFDDAWTPRDAEVDGLNVGKMGLNAVPMGRTGAEPHATKRGNRAMFQKGVPKFPMYSGLVNMKNRARDKKMKNEKP